MYFRYFVKISPCKMAFPFILPNLNPLYPRMLCAKLVEIGPVFPEKKTKMWKVYTDDGQQVIREDHYSFQLRWAKTSFAYIPFVIYRILQTYLKILKSHLISQKGCPALKIKTNFQHFHISLFAPHSRNQNLTIPQKKIICSRRR